MNLLEMREQVLFQTGHAADDIEELQPHLNDYLNDAYDQLVSAFFGVHVDEAGDYPPLRHRKSEPLIPSWAHRSLCDYASWMICRNGPASRQASGFAFRSAFEEALKRARQSRQNQIRNIPK